MFLSCGWFCGSFCCSSCFFSVRIDVEASDNTVVVVVVILIIVVDVGDSGGCGRSCSYYCC